MPNKRCRKQILEDEFSVVQLEDLMVDESEEMNDELTESSAYQTPWEKRAAEKEHQLLETERCERLEAQKKHLVYESEPEIIMEKDVEESDDPSYEEYNYGRRCSDYAHDLNFMYYLSKKYRR